MVAYSARTDLLSMIRTFTPAIASALAHMTPAGPAPIMSTSTLDSLGITGVTTWRAEYRRAKETETE